MWSQKLQNNFLWNHGKIISWIRGFVINCGLRLKKLEAQFIWEWISANSVRGQKLQNDFSWNRFKISISWIRDEWEWSSANSIWGQKLQNYFSWNLGKIRRLMKNRGLRLKRLEARFSWECTSANSIWGQKLQNDFRETTAKLTISKGDVTLHS